MSQWTASALLLLAGLTPSSSLWRPATLFGFAGIEFFGAYQAWRLGQLRPPPPSPSFSILRGLRAHAAGAEWPPTPVVVLTLGALLLFLTGAVLTFLR